MGNVWRIQTNTDSDTGFKIADYCYKHNVVAMGWSLKDSHLENYGQTLLTEILVERSNIKDFEAYESFVRKYNTYSGKVSSSVRNLLHLEINDYVWMRNSGIYYLGKVTEKSEYYYNATSEVLNLDASNQRTHVVWKKIGGESEVPGAVATAFIRGRTLQRIKKDYMYEYAQYIYEGITFNTDQLNDSDKETLLYNCLSPSDCEDLVALYLFSSENKIEDDIEHPRLKQITSQELYTWIQNKMESNSVLIPNGIKQWYRLIHNV